MYKKIVVEGFGIQSAVTQKRPLHHHNHQQKQKQCEYEVYNTETAPWIARSDLFVRKRESREKKGEYEEQWL